MYKLVQSPADTHGSDKDARWSRYRAQGIGVLCRTLTPCCVSTGRCMGFTSDRTAALPTSFFAVPIAFFAVGSHRLYTRSEACAVGRMAATDRPRQSAR